MLAKVALTAAFAGSALALARRQDTCKSQSAANPIKDMYPKSTTTGTMNATIVILPIPYEQARAIVPAEYPILKEQYEGWLLETGFPPDMFPALLEAEYGHDIYLGGSVIPDFSRAILGFPFVDRLGDGFTPFKYGAQTVVSQSEAIIAGSKEYGYNVTSAVFDPACDPFAWVEGDECGKTYMTATPEGYSSPVVSLEFERPHEGLWPYSLDFWKNVTNQVEFASSNNSACDQFVRMFNSSITPEDLGTVRGSVSMLEPAFPEDKTWNDVWGIQVDNAFVEYNFVECSGMAGYSGTGSGD